MSMVTAVDVMEQAQAIVQSVAALANKVVIAYDNDDIASKLAGVTFPGAGLIYEGMVALPEQGSTNKIGASAEMRFAIVIVMRKETIIRTDTKYPIIELLQTLRTQLLGKTSVTGHKFAFMVEAPAEAKAGTTFWVQRWRVPIQLPISQP